MVKKLKLEQLTIKIKKLKKLEPIFLFFLFFFANIKIFFINTTTNLGHLYKKKNFSHNFKKKFYKKNFFATIKKFLCDYTKNFFTTI